MLFVKVFGEEGSRLGCRPEGNDDDSDHPSGNDGQRGGGVLSGELVLGRRTSSSSGAGES
jgi:hypothetical protein